MGFQVHKLRQETLAEYLLDVRKGLGYSIAQVEACSGVLAKYLVLIEAGDYRSLPEQVYVEGVLKKLARYYRVDESLLLNQLRKEWSVSIDAGAKRNFSLKRLGKISWLPSKWGLGFGLGLSLLVVTALIYQISSLAMLPKLDVLSPVEGESINSGVLRVTGSATPGSEVMVNGQLVYVGEKGEFEVIVGVLSGAQSLEVSARNRFGRTARQTKSFVVSDVVGSNVAGPVMPSVMLGVKAEQGVLVSVLVKGVERPVGQSNELYSYFGSESTILLSTSDAGRTKVELNGKELGSLGRVGETLKNLPFSPGSSVSNEINNNIFYAKSN